jgi:hypothetical protein
MPCSRLLTIALVCSVPLGSVQGQSRLVETLRRSKPGQPQDATWGGQVIACVDSLFAPDSVVFVSSRSAPVVALLPTAAAYTVLAVGPDTVALRFKRFACRRSAVDDGLILVLIAEREGIEFALPSTGQFPVRGSDSGSFQKLGTSRQMLFIRDRNALSPLVVLAHRCGPDCVSARIIAETEWADTNRVWKAEAQKQTAMRDSILQVEQARARAGERRKLLARGWRRDYVDLIMAGRVAIGMNAEMVRIGWGEPQSITRTVLASGTHEQWVYRSGTYVYLDNGLVSGIQTSTSR